MSYERTQEEVSRLIKNSTHELNQKSYESSWIVLAEAHILSQPYALLHVLVHWHMLLLAFKQRNWTEIIGQTIRLIVAGPGSLSGKFPLGNTGRSNVNMFLPQAISPQLKEKIDSLKEN